MRNSGSIAVAAKPASVELSGIVSVGDVIAAGALWATGERHDVIRGGEREPIPSHVRAAVWYRDRGRCADCPIDHPSGDVMHLDHIKPWSAGGSDTTDNLRLLCERHNLKRSNFVDFVRPKRPATWWCANCYMLDEHRWTYESPWTVTCPRHLRMWSPDPDHTSCRVGRAFGRAYLAGAPMPTWHMRPLFEEADLTTVAYCAHCNRPGVTGYPL